MLRTTTAATVEPVSLVEAKAHLRLIHNAHDAMVSGLITAAREVVELETGVALAAASYMWTPEHRPAYGYRPSLPLWPAVVDSVTAWDGSAQTAVADYLFDDVVGVLSLGTNASPRVSFTTAPTVIPPALKSAILLLVADLYERAESNVAGESIAANPSASRLIWPYRRNLGV